MTSEMKKFLLVDASNINDLRSAIGNKDQRMDRGLPQASRELNRLDQRMLAIINDKSITEEDRVVKYNDTLAEFQQLKATTTAPVKSVLRQLPDQSSESSAGYNPLVGIPAIYHKKAQQLLNLITKTGGLNLNTRGGIVSDRAYEGTANITDLLNKAINPKFSARKNVKSWDVFQKMLSELQIPRTLLGTNYRDSTDEPSTITNGAYHTPVIGTSTIEKKSRRRRRRDSDNNWISWPAIGNRSM